MSGYRDEHNITDEETNENSANSDVNNGRTHPTLQQAINEFLTTPTYSTESRRLMSSMIDYIQPENSDNNLSINGTNLQLFQSMLQSIVENPNSIIADLNGENESKGVDDSFLDTLERVNIKTLPKDSTCPICTNDFKDDKYPLIVELPCNKNHRFDLDCIGPWLKVNKTCPLCRTDVTINKNKVELVDSEVEEDDWEMYG